MYAPFGGFLAASAGLAVGVLLGLQGWHLKLLAAAFFCFGMATWLYSPLPDHNGGMMAGDPGCYWGWSDDDGDGR